MRDGLSTNYHRSVRFSVLACAAAASAWGQQSLAESGFDHFYNLEYEASIADFSQAIAQNPDLPELHNHLAQAIVFQEMFRNGALESELVSGNNSFLRRPKLNPAPATEKRFLDEVAKAMELANDRLKKNSNDTAAMYSL